VIDLHSARTNGFLEELATRFDAQADRLGWIVAYPDGFAYGWEPYGCCQHPGVGDVAFISELISRLESSDGVDPERVYVTGLSRGGMMAYRLGCELPSRVAAIAATAGNMADENGNVRGVPCQPERPVSVLSVHGSADPVVPIRGGGRVAPLDDVIGRWRGLNGCDSPESVTVRGPVVARTWRCRRSSEVTSMLIEGVGTSGLAHPSAACHGARAHRLTRRRSLATSSRLTGVPLSAPPGALPRPAGWPVIVAGVSAGIALAAFLVNSLANGLARSCHGYPGQDLVGSYCWLVSLPSLWGASASACSRCLCPDATGRRR
jgi:polyhydroxybutyrate depolymerase